MNKNRSEKIKIKTEQVFEKVNELTREGHARRVTIKDKHGSRIVTFPLTLGIAAAVIAPILASIGVVAFFVTESTVSVHKKTS